MFRPPYRKPDLPSTCSRCHKPKRVLVLSTSTGICYCFECIGETDVLKDAETNFQADYNVLTLSTDDKRLLEGMRIGTRDEHDEP